MRRTQRLRLLPFVPLNLICQTARGVIFLKVHFYLPHMREVVTA